MFTLEGLDVRLRGLMVTVSIALAGSAAYYLRKIYRAGFDGRLRIESAESTSAERFAALLYILGRPIMSIPLSTAVALSLILTYTTVAPTDIPPTENLLYILGVAGFLTGFLNGRVIEQIETSGSI